MKTPAQGGFTIVEVILFLAVTGLLMIGVLVGSSATLGQQRYRDSVNSLKGLIQEQYSSATNVINDSIENPVCTRTGAEIRFADETKQARGTSECLQIGRFLLVESTETTTYSVIGESTVEEMGESDTETLQNYALTLTSPEVRPIAWGAKVVVPKKKDDLRAGVLILHSPLSGSIITYAQSSLTESEVEHIKAGTYDLAAIVSDSNVKEVNLCVDSQGLSGMGRRMAVRIGAGASGQSSVEIPLERESVCD